ncbi:sigma-70 family RNA polymerase sigma factor [Secundilactobacillus paracollinoides]|uniref:sigma-70 family RNA polymerase sigma factor n=1 Tax=Secundilactobacillus paracollinoides TaxID=240427 RepID=UPI0006CF3A57|nr:sigma-70 family RNA polymerase sigma factor [Secundilactobacillus paracollinoides]
MIIHSALKKLGMRPSDDAYDDYVQDCWLWFSEIFQKYAGNPWSEPKSFLAYAHVALYRRSLNERMRLQKHDNVTDDAPTGNKWGKSWRC